MSTTTEKTPTPPQTQTATATANPDRTPRSRVMVTGFHSKTPRAVLKKFVIDNDIDARVMPTFHRRPGQYNFELRQRDQIEKLKQVLVDNLEKINAEIAELLGEEEFKKSKKSTQLKFTELPPRSQVKKEIRAKQEAEKLSSKGSETSVAEQDGGEDKQNATTQENKKEKKEEKGERENKDKNEKDNSKQRRGARNTKRQDEDTNTKVVESIRPGAVHFNIAKLVKQSEIRDLIPEYPEATVFIGKHRSARSRQGYVVITVKEDEQEKLLESLNGKEVAGKTIKPNKSKMYTRVPLTEEEKAVNSTANTEQN